MKKSAGEKLHFPAWIWSEISKFFAKKKKSQNRFDFPLLFEDIQLIRLLDSIVQSRPHFRTTAKYNHVSSEKLIASFSANGWLLAGTSEAKVRNKSYQGYQRHTLRFYNPSLTWTDGRPEILVINSHMGRGSVQVLCAAVESACTNGLVFGESYGSSTIPHVGYTHQRITQAIDYAVMQFPRILALRSRMQACVLTNSQRHAFSHRASFLRTDKKGNRPDCHELLACVVPEQASWTLWNIFNIVQSNLLRGSKSRITPRGFRTLRGITDILRDVELNAALFGYAVEMLEDISSFEKIA